MVDFVQTVSATTNAFVDAASYQDKPAARMWADTSKTLTDIYTQALQEARKDKTTETHDQAMPLDFSIEHVMKTQLDNIEAILMSEDADTCLPFIVNQAEALKEHVPAAAKGIGKGLLNAANPVNLAKGFYYTVHGTSKALSFILIQSARFQCYSEFALKNPALAQKFLDDYKAENQRVADTFDGIITHMQDEWDRMSGPERTEFIFQAITEVITMPTFQHAYLKGLDDTFNHVASHMHEAFNKAPSAVTAEGIPVPYHVAEEMLQEAENPVQKAATGEKIKAEKPLDRKLAHAAIEIETFSKEQGMQLLANSKELKTLELNIRELNKKTEEIPTGLIETRIKGDPEKFVAALEGAEKQYEVFRTSKTDIASIAKNTGITEKTLAAIKHHVFYAEHKLKGNIVAKFAADPDMANAWQRLIDGNFIQSDLRLLLHEYAEVTLLKKHPNLTAENVHTIAAELYNWQDFV